MFLQSIFAVTSSLSNYFATICSATCHLIIHEPVHDKTHKMICAPSLISVFALCRKKALVLSYPLSTQRRPGADPGFLDRGFKLAERGSMCSLTKFSWNSSRKWNNLGSRGCLFEPPEPPLYPPLKIDQTGQSLHWAHKSFCWFCHAVAHMYNHTVPYLPQDG